MTDKVMQEQEMHGLQQCRIHNTQKRYKLSNRAGRVCGDLKAFAARVPAAGESAGQSSPPQ